MARAPRAAEPQDELELADGSVGDGEDVVLEGTLVCALTGEHKAATPHEETLQCFIDRQALYVASAEAHDSTAIYPNA